MGTAVDYSGGGRSSRAPALRGSWRPIPRPPASAGACAGPTSGAALALVAVAALVVAWPRLRAPAPDVPRGAAVPVARRLRRPSRSRRPRREPARRRAAARAGADDADAGSRAAHARSPRRPRRARTAAPGDGAAPRRPRRQPRPAPAPVAGAVDGVRCRVAQPASCAVPTGAGAASSRASCAMSASWSSIQSPGSRAVTIALQPVGPRARAPRRSSSAPRGSSRRSPGCRTG